MSSVQEIADYIWRRSPQYGVNPSTALGIAKYEGLNPNTLGSRTFGNPDARGYSFGPFQLYSGSSDPSKIAPGGMAYEFYQKYGQAPSRENWQQQVDFSLERMAKKGTGDWYAVRDRGGIEKITELGSQYAKSVGLSGEGSPAAQVGQTVPQVTAQSTPQFAPTAMPQESASQPPPAPTSEMPQAGGDFFKGLGALGMSLMSAGQQRQTPMLAPVGNRPRRKIDLFDGGLLG
jgi:hypothetical protein